MWKIQINALLDLMQASKNLFPREYASLLGGNIKEQIITEYVVPPVLSGKSFATIDLLALPIDSSIIGSVHSHPAGRGIASGADKKMFRRYPINIILFYPYKENDLVAYNSKSEPVDIEIVRETEH